MIERVLRALEEVLCGDRSSECTELSVLACVKGVLDV